MTLPDRMVVMRDGRTAQEGTPLDVYANPADTFVATFVGSPKMNLMASELTGEYFTLPTRFTIGLESADTSRPVTRGVRPGDLVLAAADGDGAAQVKLIELLGPRPIVTIDARGTELT